MHFHAPLVYCAPSWNGHVARLELVDELLVLGDAERERGSQSDCVVQVLLEEPRGVLMISYKLP